jgi:pimeloyl-ACP methyl ester carboxylesterase
MALTCHGSGTPTVVVLPGLGSSGSSWDAVAIATATTYRTRVCAVDRPGLGHSDARAPGAHPSVGDMAGEVASLLLAARVPTPYVVVAHSYGGLVARALVAQHGSDVAGMVYVDASTLGELQSPYFAGVDWSEGGITVDIPRSEVELASAPDVGSTPVVVLTQDASGEFAAQWLPLQDGLAATSSDRLHVVVTDVGHVIQQVNPGIVEAAAGDVVVAVRRGALLPACTGSGLPALGGRCR